MPYIYSICLPVHFGPNPMSLIIGPKSHFETHKIQTEVEKSLDRVFYFDLRLTEISTVSFKNHWSFANSTVTGRAQKSQPWMVTVRWPHKINHPK